MSRASPTARGCARSSASSSCATRCGGSRRRSAPTRPAAPAAAAAEAVERRGVRERRARRPTSRALERRARGARGRAPRPAADRGRAAPARGGAGAAARPTRAARLVAARCDDPARAVAMAPASARSSRHDAKALAARRRPAPTLAHDTLVAAYLLDPARRGYPARRAAPRSAASRSTSRRARRAADARSCIARARRAAARAARASAGSTRLLDEVELPLVDVLREMERAGVKLDVDRLAEIAGAFEPTAAQLEREIWELAGEEFTIGSPQQLARGPVRQARAVAQAPRQDRLLDRRARAAGDPRRARDHPQDRALARADEARSRPTSTRCPR